MRFYARSQQPTSMQGAGSMHDGACSTCCLVTSMYRHESSILTALRRTGWRDAPRRRPSVCLTRTESSDIQHLARARQDRVELLGLGQRAIVRCTLYAFIVSPFGLPCPISVRTRRPSRSPLPTCRRAGDEPLCHPPPPCGSDHSSLGLGLAQRIKYIRRQTGSPGGVGYAYICEPATPAGHLDESGRRVDMGHSRILGLGEFDWWHDTCGAPRLAFVPGIRRPQKAVEAFWKLAGRRQAKQERHEGPASPAAGPGAPRATASGRARPSLPKYARMQVLYTDTYSAHGRW